MRKVVNKLLLIIILLLPISINASKEEVTFKDCVDGDTAKVILNEEVITIRFLAIDTPETKHPTKGEEPFGKEASNYTCSSLKNANKIEIEYDDNADILDKYNRYLVWIFIDDKLLQKSLIEMGYAKTAYLYDDYKYTEDLQKKENIAKENKIGIWGDYEEEKIDYTYIFLALVIVALLCIFSKTYRKKIIKKLKLKIKNI